MKTGFAAITLLASLVAAGTPCKAQEMGLNVDLGLATAYFFRGLNVFQEDGQMNQNMLLAPSVTWSVPGTSLQVGYWGAYQLTGDNKSVNVDGGLGAEQDFWVGYGTNLAENLALSAILTAYYYPLADENIAGTSNPLYLEPGVGLTWTGDLDLGIKLAYMYGVQDEVKAGRYLYINPFMSSAMNLTSTLKLVGSLWGGYKIFNDSDITFNQLDAGLTLAVPIALAGSWYVKPAGTVVWTNIGDKDVADELGACFMVNVGVDL